MVFISWAFKAMPLREKAVLLAFLAAVVVVFVWAGAIILGEAVLRWRCSPRPARPRWRRICRACVLSLAAAGILCAAYAWLV